MNSRLWEIRMTCAYKMRRRLDLVDSAQDRGCYTQEERDDLAASILEEELRFYKNWLQDENITSVLELK